MVGTCKRCEKTERGRGEETQRAENGRQNERATSRDQTRQTRQTEKDKTDRQQPAREKEKQGKRERGKLKMEKSNVKIKCERVPVRRGYGAEKRVKVSLNFTQLQKIRAHCIAVMAIKTLKNSLRLRRVRMRTLTEPSL